MGNNIYCLYISSKNHPVQDWLADVVPGTVLGKDWVGTALCQKIVLTTQQPDAVNKCQHLCGR
ncbi:hypothetical protein [Cylindrospermum sp. FACHB-282]|uniref:hypothetical protein n=1 Tax=Cylindrospermum sp. FACHB-282 TaxID=2692794 RepID=UPI00168887DE|nr:hypothetical protein [Cylindrospermum sp. FACHB-282]MBD2387278.1 hypothetical protein [Cylindrospermum sp. FACHB-282]